jgi:hypothetical protein
VSSRDSEAHRGKGRGFVHKVRIYFLSRESRRKKLTTIWACDRCRAWSKGILYFIIKSIKLGLLRKERLRGSEWPSDVVSFLFVIHSPLPPPRKNGRSTLASLASNFLQT